ELHKFSDGTLNDVRNALDNCMKGIRMQYLPTTIWRRGDKDRAATMIQAIEKMLKTRRILRSLKKFVGGRLLTAAAKGKPPAKAKVQLTPQSTDEGTGSKPRVLDVPSDDSEDKISWNSSDDEDVNAQDKDISDDEGDKKDESDGGKEDDDDDDKDGAERDDDEEEITKIDEPEDTESGGGDDEETESDEESDEEETREEEEESFDLISKTLKDSEDDGNGEEGLKVSKEQRLIEEEEADELYRDVDINQGRGLQLSQDIEDSHVTLTSVNPDGQQTNPFAKAVSNISGIVQQYMNQQMNDAVRVAVQIQTDRLRDSYQRENDEFLRTIDDNMKRIIKEQVKRTSYAVAADLLEMELKKILIEKMEGNQSIQRFDEQRNLYKAFVEAYEADKIILDTYRECVILKRRRDDDDQGEGPSAGSDRGSKRQREGKELESARALLEPTTRSAGRSTTGSKSRQTSASEFNFTEEPVQTTSQIEKPSHLVFKTGAKDQPIVQTSHHPEWFPQPKKPLTLDCDWNKTLPAAQGSTQLWISDLAKQADSRSSFNELLDTPLDFSNFIMNRLRVDTLTPELLAGPTYELMRGSCNSLTELEYHLEEVYKVTTDQLDWVNPKGQQYPHNLLQPLPLIPDNRGRRVIPFAHFINNDLVYLRGGALSRKYTTSVTKTKAADYRHIKWIKDLVHRTMWIQEPINYDKHALWGVSHWGRKRQQFYGFAVNQESALNVYSKRRIIAVIDLKIVEWRNYKHLDWILVCRDNDKIYKFKEGNFKRLRLQDIEDMLLLLVQGKLSNLTIEERFAFNVSLRMFTRSIIIQQRVEDL
nr:hypothetical protein [Tanacetum cinerariifolium]